MAIHDDHDASDRRGLSELARSILDHGSDYAEARLELAKVEAEEAADHLRRISVRLGIGAFAGISGYTIAVIGGIALIGNHLLGGRWELAALAVGLLHLIIGGLFLLGARHQAKQSSELFSSTRRELTKDQQWLKQKSKSKTGADAPN